MKTKRTNGLLKAIRSANSYLTAAIIVCVILLSYSCKKGEPFQSNAMEDIESISYSALKRLEPINVIFKEDIAYIENLEKACVLTPAVKGEWKAVGAKQITFTPSEAYDFNNSLNLNLDVGLLQNNKANIKGLSASFIIAQPEFKITYADLIPDEKDDTVFYFEATCETDIPVSIETVGKIVKAELEGNSLKEEQPVNISQGSSANTYKININKIRRKKYFQNLIVSWDLKSLGADEAGKKEFTVSAESVFQVTSITQENESEICISFSDRLDESQDLRGFINVTSSGGYTYWTSIDGYKVKVFVQNMVWPDDAKISVLEGIKNAKGKKLDQKADFSVKTVWEKPAVEFTAGGNILPVKDNARVLVSTKNISGLTVEAFQIFDKNMLQYFQVNSTISGINELKRVGEPVWRQSFDFEWNSSMKNRYVVRSLDMTKLIKKFPGGMFYLKVSFIKKHSKYEPISNTEDFSGLPFPRDAVELEGFKDIESDYWENADLTNEQRYKFWSMRDNPMHPAYYLPSYGEFSTTSKVILVSNIGLSVKRDRENKLYIAAADLISAEPMSGVTVKLFTYAQKEAGEGKTDSQGLLMLENEKDAYFIQAEKNGDFNWITLQSDVLSTSHFEVDGEKSKGGIKGFIYGERGVWRPGDDMHLVFILQDSEKKLPEDFPVIFTLEDPLGKRTDFKTLTSSVNGFYKINTKTGESDKTGTWTAYVTAGGKTWSKSLKVEAIVPNRLFVNLEPQAEFLTSGENSVKLRGEWLHGAKASDLKAEISARYFLNRTPFEKYKNYTFINPELQVKSGVNKVWEGRLNSEGKTDINLNLFAGEKTPGKLKAVFETRIYEPSGAFSIENKTFDYSPYSQYVGMEIPKSDDKYREMLFTGKDRTLNFAVLTPQGNPVKGNTPLTVKLYKLEWYWWWETDYESVNYTSSRNTRFIKSWDIQAKNGKADLKIKVDDGDWGRYLIAVHDNEGKHSSAQIVYFDWEGWASRRTNDESSDSMLMLTSDKAKYSAGDTAEITFPSYEGARALVTLEKNGKVLKQEWIKASGKIASYKVKLQPSMAPNIYVHISLIQEHSQTKNSLPIRLYGIAPITVEDAGTRLKPVIKTASSYEPNSKAAFTVSEENGKPMTFTVAVVDEGLLGLTAFGTQNPWDYFYKKESSQLSSWDIYNYVIGAYSGEIESLLAVGGGGGIDRKGVKNAERFKPVVFFFGPYEIKAKEKKQIEFEMPQYIGAVRIMAVAGKDGAYGIIEETVKVKSDLIVMPTLPRTVGAGETVEIPVTVFNGTNSDKNTKVSLKSEGVVKISEEKQVRVPAGGDATVSFTVQTDKTGIAKFYAGAEAGGVKPAKAETEIDVLSRGTPYSSLELVNVQGGKSWSKDISLKGETGTKKLTVEISQMPALGLEKRLSYLIDYPFGCMEQITSKAFPQIYLPLMAVLDAKKTEDVKTNILSVLDRYQNYQLRSGGFSYWPGGGDESTWATNYAGHFMLEAKKAGYTVNETVYQAWLTRQTELAKNWSSNFIDSMENQAYRLFTLALAGSPDIGAMNRLKNMEDSLNEVSKSMLAASYALSGHIKTARLLLEKVYEPTTVYRYSGRNYSSNIRDTALILSAYTITGDNSRTSNLIQKLAKVSSSDEWLSTQETAWLLLSLAPHYKFDKSKEVSCEIVCGTTTFKETIHGASKIFEMPVESETTKNLKIKNTGGSPLYAAINVSGKLLPGEETDFSSNLNIKADFFTEDEEKIEPENLQLGARFKLKITVKNISNADVDNVALSLPVPTGWEMTNLRLGTSEESKNEDEEEEEDYNDGSSVKKLYDYQDFRDTHIYTHFNLTESETKTFEFMGTVTYGGSYYIPAIYAEAMYDNGYKAVIKGVKITAKR
ncbi:alpha-2-macroglobulin family protein [Treponema pedis]|uniref:alpha-2-macroglobulin family protein n=1 Tax=Treponema pedis TaxID=409322 RepID=UPI0004281D61|nr:MG2 domain-containing protein [Treponema pedis]